MMKAIKLAAVVAVAGLMTGCASTSDIDNLQSQIDTLKSQISSASSDAASAQAAAAEAAAKAAAAEAAANRAAQYAQDTNSKLDRMFKKSMMK
ncbi:Lpp/OprI family alanine-zipper lipoprotein [Methylomarinum sp. Ch1-1]|uniref:Lpp/OprI family alanine-zipper lipoprotein n=1 Tax=Methylomarinum roseum TaxID=3067653 RepID=A0AAU7NVC6_9GAMM|nr:Lpp/OprI family alanine-zipper lipoprotein [Methylomarinum sp. Ch1-1]MDP4523032.1 Lpp/OprI family alanine-zipper lipoprotein [Methylomarinum sp. Ch1-1]